MAKKFSAQLRRCGERIWRAIEGHSFLRELHAGTLPMNRFTYFILQDYVYLLDFAQVLCQGGAKSPDLETLELFARHALGAVEVERSFHTSFGKSLGLSRQQLDGVPKGPITQAYISHLQSVARSGTLGELVAAVFLVTGFMGRWDGASQKQPTNKPKIYRQWIETYASESFWQLVREQIRLMDKLGAAAKRQRNKAHG